MRSAKQVVFTTVLPLLGYKAVYECHLQTGRVETDDDTSTGGGLDGTFDSDTILFLHLETRMQKRVVISLELTTLPFR